MMLYIAFLLSSFIFDVVVVVVVVVAVVVVVWSVEAAQDILHALENQMCVKIRISGYGTVKTM